MKKCSSKCYSEGISCDRKGCRHWISFEEENNCCLVSIYLNGDMTLEQISERLGISIPRVQQIQNKALAKLNNADTFGI